MNWQESVVGRLEQFYDSFTYEARLPPRCEHRKGITRNYASLNDSCACGLNCFRCWNGIRTAADDRSPMVVDRSESGLHCFPFVSS
jgi:hypothetical protein